MICKEKLVKYPGAVLQLEPAYKNSAREEVYTFPDVCMKLTQGIVLIILSCASRHLFSEHMSLSVLFTCILSDCLRLVRTLY